MIALNPTHGIRVDVRDDATVSAETRVPRLNFDLSVHADVPAAAAVPLVANTGLASDGVKLHGKGFILGAEEANALLARDGRNSWVVRPYRNGRDMAHRPRNHYVIDFALMSEEEARAFVVPFQLVLDRVKPQRLANNRESYARLWWRFGEPRAEFRPSLRGVDRYIVTVDTSRRRFFTFVAPETVVDDKLVCIASAEAWVLGILSSRVHLLWALAAGGRLGVGNDPVYVKTLCFDPFPMPDPAAAIRLQVADLAERLETFRRTAIDRDKTVTMTGMYGVVEKLRSGEALTEKERKIHEIAACGVLKDMHDELDALVATAYGWEWPLEKEVILERLVALHNERVAEERQGRCAGSAQSTRFPALARISLRPPRSSTSLRPRPSQRRRRSARSGPRTSSARSAPSRNSCRHKPSPSPKCPATFPAPKSR